MISFWPIVEAKALSGTVDAIIVVLGLDAWQKPGKVVRPQDESETAK